MNQETRKKEFKPVAVHNNDIPLLSDILCIMQEIRIAEEQRQFQRDRMQNVTQHLTGMPGGHGVPKGLDDAFSVLSEIEEQHEGLCREYARKIKQAQAILNGIKSQSMRTFVLLKYVFDVPDTEIREELNMTRRGFDKARIAVETAPDMRSVQWREKYVVVNS